MPATLELIVLLPLDGATRAQVYHYVAWCYASMPGDPRQCVGWRQGGRYWWDGSEPSPVGASRSGRA
jgi:hypothetical protein